MAGVISTNEEIKSQTIDEMHFDDILTFIGKLLIVLDSSSNYLEDLMTSNQTRNFLLENFYDLIMMTKYALKEVMFQENSDIFQRIIQMMNQAFEAKKHFDTIFLSLPSAFAVF